MDRPTDRPSRASTLAHLSSATQRLVATVTSLDDAALAQPSGLPGWTRGHVVAHLSRNADGLGNLVTWADTGVETPMYVSRDARAAAIEADAYRPAAVQLADLVDSAEALSARLEAMSNEADDALLRMVSGAEIEGWELVHLRLREVEIHHVDLAAGYSPANWPADLSGPTAALLGWLIGRTDGSDLTPTGRDDVPPPLPWA